MYAYGLKCDHLRQSIDQKGLHGFYQHRRQRIACSPRDFFYLNIKIRNRLIFVKIYSMAINDCVTASMFMCQPEWIKHNLSRRFHFCLCKMLDGGLSSGTTMITGLRAVHGWGMVPEASFFPSNRKLSEEEYSNWRKIPPIMWEYSKKIDILGNEQLLKTPNVLYRKEYLNNNKKFEVYMTCFSALGFLHTNLNVCTSKFETAGWLNVMINHNDHTAYPDDLFVKPEFRRIGIGNFLLKELEFLILSGTLEGYVMELQTGKKAEIKNVNFRIPSVDIYTKNRKEAALKLFRKNGYKLVIDDSKKIVDSKLLAIKEIK